MPLDITWDQRTSFFGAYLDHTLGHSFQWLRSSPPTMVHGLYIGSKLGPMWIWILELGSLKGIMPFAKLHIIKLPALALKLSNWRSWTVKRPNLDPAHKYGCAWVVDLDRAKFDKRFKPKQLTVLPLMGGKEVACKRGQNRDWVRRFRSRIWYRLEIQVYLLQDLDMAFASSC